VLRRIIEASDRLSAALEVNLAGETSMSFELPAAEKAALGRFSKSGNSGHTRHRSSCAAILEVKAMI
jgi:hypothetical protein